MPEISERCGLIHLQQYRNACPGAVLITTDTDLITCPWCKLGIAFLGAIGILTEDNKDSFEEEIDSPHYLIWS